MILGSCLKFQAKGEGVVESCSSFAMKHLVRFMKSMSGDFFSGLKDQLIQELYHKAQSNGLLRSSDLSPFHE